MRKLLAITILALSATSAYAQTAEEIIKPICDNEKVVLSKRAKWACEGKERYMPVLKKDGKEFYAKRTGSEFNTIQRNIEKFN